MMPLTRSHFRRGFTLFELLVATVCLATIGIGALQALKYGNDKTALTSERSAALQSALSRMEILKSEAFNGTLISGINATPISVNGLSVPATLVTTITSVPSTPLLSVNVTVQWDFQTSTGSEAQQISLDSTLWNGNVT